MNRLSKKFTLGIVSILIFSAVCSVSNETDSASLDISKIWNPYYTGEKSRNKNLSGTGLGLSIVKKICETQTYVSECSRHENQIIFTIKIPLTG